MIDALKRKLTSQRGASLLLALLFLLICGMVSSSILMASVSNAGKHRSNREEHQTYLALSSAVSLLCDELNRTEYRGQYRFWKTEKTVTNPDGSKHSIILRHFEQLEGAYDQIGTNTAGYLKTMLISDLDVIFANEIRTKLSNGAGFESFKTKSGKVLPHTLTITPQTKTGLDDKTVEIKLNIVEKSYAIEVTADLDDYQIRAELTPTTSKPTLPASLSDEGTRETDPLQWKIGWITTGNKEVEP